MCKGQDRKDRPTHRHTLERKKKNKLEHGTDGAVELHHHDVRACYAPGSLASVLSR